MAKESPITASDQWFVREDKTLKWTVYQSNGTTLQNITGFTIKFYLLPLGSDTPVVTKTATVTNGPNGLCEAVIVPGDTAFAPDNYYYCLKRTDAGFNAVLAYGLATLLPNTSAT